MIRTGVHTVADVFCLGCNDRLGWFYHKAADHSQKYKEGSHVSISFVRDIGKQNRREISSRTREIDKGELMDFG